MTNLLHKAVKFVWDPEAHHAFEEFKTTSTVPAQLNPTAVSWIQWIHQIQEELKDHLNDAKKYDVVYAPSISGKAQLLQ